MPFTGENDGNVFTDTSLYNLSPIVNGVVTKTAHQKFNSGSAYFNSGSFLVFNSLSSLGIGTNNFTIDFWLYPLSLAGYVCILGIFGDPDYIYLGINNTNNGQPLLWREFPAIPGHKLFVLNEWQHLALIKHDGVVKLYLNGRQTGPDYIYNYNLGNTATLTIGATPGGSQGFSGYLQYCRIVVGKALWLDDFPVPDKPSGLTVRTGNVEPTWPTTPGQTVTDNGILWENKGRIMQPATQGPIVAT